jgi:hypothetical protein
MTRVVWTALILAVAACCSAHESPPPRSDEHGPAVPSIAGDVVHPLELGKNRAAVLVFVLRDCPISNAYAPEINRMVSEYAVKGIAFYVVHADRDASDAELKKHAEEFGYSCPVLADRQRALSDCLDIAVAPEAAVVGADQKLLYRGRIDDRFVDFGKERKEPTTHELRDALEAIIAGKPLAVERSRAVGCSLR